MNINELIAKVKVGLADLKVDEKYKVEALKFIEQWLKEDQFKEYVPQILFLIEEKKWDLLLDCFYQIIPFGTGGRRGEVGIGPNKINKWTIQSSAQGHSQYLIDKFGEEAKTRGVVISYDVRVYTKKGDYSDEVLNPLSNLTCEDLSVAAAEVYAANGIKTYLFDDYTSTPEMSYMVRYLGTVAGDMISASHNPPEFNGIKVVNEFGGQLISPADQTLVDVVKNEIEAIKVLNYDKAISDGLIKILTKEDHQAYIDAASKISMNDYRSAKVLFSPYNGTPYASVMPVLKNLKFDVVMDGPTGNPDGRFPTIMYNIPNPEVKESYLGLLDNANKIGADIILVTDPDGDRIGLMSKENGKWVFINGNEIMVLCTNYMIDELKAKDELSSSKVIIKTLVTTNLLTKMAEKYDLEIVKDLLVGIKYVAKVMDDLKDDGRIQDLLLGGEESHGLTAGDYIREKDSCVPAILLSELASKVKDEDKTLMVYLDEIYSKFGYFLNFQDEIRLPGAQGMSQIAKIQSELRQIKPTSIGRFKIIKMEDRWEGEPFSSESDKVSRNVIVFDLKPTDDSIETMNVTIRPSGTEPKSKIYFEIGMKPSDDLQKAKKYAEELGEELDKTVLTYLYKLIDIDFPIRGFLLFRMLPTQDKLQYFRVEPQIEALKSVKDKVERQQKLDEILSFLGANPVEKVDKAFVEKNGVGILEYLGL